MGRSKAEDAGSSFQPLPVHLKGIDWRFCVQHLKDGVVHRCCCRADCEKRSIADGKQGLAHNDRTDFCHEPAKDTVI